MRRTSTRRTLILTLTALLIAAPTGTAVAVPGSIVEPGVARAGALMAASVDLAASRRQILADTNSERAKAGLPALAADGSLDTTAQSCSQAQARNDSMAHCIGYHQSYPAGWTWAAENVAAGYQPSTVVGGWMGSDGHRKNILNTSATHIGIGVAVSSSGRIYFTQNFAAYPPSVKPTGPQYYRTAYDGTIWRVDGSAATALSWSQWSAAGFPAYRAAPTDYVRYSWSSSVAAVTFFGAAESTWVWKPLDYAGWLAAGKPAPRAVAWIPGSTLHQWGTSDELFLKDTGGVVHKLTYAEWVATGKKGFERRENQGYVRLSWDGSGAVAFMCDLAGGKGGQVSWAQWQAAALPRPKAVVRTAADQVTWGPMPSAAGAARGIDYTGAVLRGKRLTYTEWRAMGMPLPTSERVEPVATTC